MKRSNVNGWTVEERGRELALWAINDYEWYTTSYAEASKKIHDRMDRGTYRRVLGVDMLAGSPLVAAANGYRAMRFHSHVKFLRTARLIAAEVIIESIEEDYRQLVDSGERMPKKARLAAPDNAVVRAWAKANGYRITDRGRIPSDVAAAYRRDESVRARAWAKANGIEVADRGRLHTDLIARFRRTVTS